MYKSGDIVRLNNPSINGLDDVLTNGFCIILNSGAKEPKLYRIRIQYKLVHRSYLAYESSLEKITQ